MYIYARINIQMANIHIKIEDKEKEDLKKASKKEHLSLTSFLRRTSLKEAEKILEVDNGATTNN